jgi:glycogen synthase
LQWIKYSGAFEVIVVNGPSTDNSDEVIASWLSKIRYARCPVANLSVSRNIGICMAQGEIVAFIDDDAIPEPEWLTQLTEPYRDSTVGGTGGFVYDHTGYAYQFQYCLVDRLGTDIHVKKPTLHFSYPKSEQCPTLIGCNSSFRRSILLEIGGFDEEYEYYLDETDVCLRIIDLGYLIVQLPNAFVHHKFAASNRRVNRITKNYYSIIKNKAYFSLKHGSEFYSTEHIVEKQHQFIKEKRQEVERVIKEGYLTQKDLDQFDQEAMCALSHGVARGFEGVAANAMINREKILRYCGAFNPFIIDRESKKSIIFISKSYAPENFGGIATFTKTIAETLAAMGHIVHVITLGSDSNRVDFESGVWVHRILVQKITRRPALKLSIPEFIWNWSATALKECRRIETHRSIDLVEAPIWDCEGIAFLLEGHWPLITSLHTTLHFWLDSKPHLRKNRSWMSSLGNPVLQLEKKMMTQSHAIRANSQAIKQAIETAYQFKFNDTLHVIPHGLPKIPTPQIPKRKNGIEILFVGRFEHRKGIDILLQVIPDLLSAYKDVTFRLIGNDQLPDENGYFVKHQFIKTHQQAAWLSRVYFSGEITEQALQAAYLSCDLFVAPSRFESFGLIYLEAMRAGKPVIGCNVGGIPEVVSHEKNGLLVPPDDAAALMQAIVWMIEHPLEREHMGKVSKQLFEHQFTLDKMGYRTLQLYDLAIGHHLHEDRLHL